MKISNVATKYAMDLSKSNMQSHLKSLSDNPNPKYYELLRDIFDFE